MSELRMDRPLACVDIESTGANPRLDRIVELAIVKVMPDGSRESHHFRINPQMRIPPEATAIHGIRDADVANCPTFRDLARPIFDILKDCDLAGYNILRFDAVMLTEEFARADLRFDTDERRIVDAQRIFHRKEPRDLTAALAFFCNETHKDSHSAMADVLATLKVIEAELKRYPDLPRDTAGLNEYCRPPRHPQWADKTGRLKWDGNELVVNFGVQYHGQKVRDLVQNKPKFLKWILSSDFPIDTKRIVSDALEGRYPAPPPPAALPPAPPPAEA